MKFLHGKAAHHPTQVGGMGKVPQRKDVPPWLHVPEDLENPEVLQAKTSLLDGIMGPDRCLIPDFEKVTKVMLELRPLESPDLIEVLVYGEGNKKMRAKWMLQSLMERHRMRQERLMNKLGRSMNSLVLEPGLKSE